MMIMFIAVLKFTHTGASKRFDTSNFLWFTLLMIKLSLAVDFNFNISN